MNKKTQIVECPFCNYPVEIDVDFAIKNGRVFCGTCCKSFEVNIQSEQEEYEPLDIRDLSDDFSL
jgi:transcription elongation factor Elf1